MGLRPLCRLRVALMITMMRLWPRLPVGAELMGHASRHDAVIQVSR